MSFVTKNKGLGNAALTRIANSVNKSALDFSGEDKWELLGILEEKMGMDTFELLNSVIKLMNDAEAVSVLNAVMDEAVEQRLSMPEDRFTARKKTSQQFAQELGQEFGQKVNDFVEDLPEDQKAEALQKADKIMQKLMDELYGSVSRGVQDMFPDEI